MKGNYDFSNGQKNPYTKKLKRKVTIQLSEEVLEYFKSMAAETSIPYQTLIDFYLLDCVRNNKELHFE